MSRVRFFYDAQGKYHPNTSNLVAPFTLMNCVGDYLEISEHDCISGNLLNLSSFYTNQLGRRFSARRHQRPDGSFLYRVTLISLTLGKAKPSTETKKASIFRVDTFFDRNGNEFGNTCVDDHGFAQMYPFDAMSSGDYFFVHATKTRRRSAVETAIAYGKKHGKTFAFSHPTSSTLLVAQV